MSHLACCLPLLLLSPQQSAPAVAPLVQLCRMAEHDLDTTWTGLEPLVLRVELRHPCWRGPAPDAEFVLDPDGGFAQALALLVVDASGHAVPWTFTRQGGEAGQPLRLHRLGCAGIEFRADPGAVAPGRYEVRARLLCTTGSWRGSVDSRPLVLTVPAAPPPTLRVTADPVLHPGWPTVVTVTLTAAENGTVQLPTDAATAATALALTLATAAGADVAVAAAPLLPPTRTRGVLAAGDTWSVRFRVPAEATAALAAGEWQWTARYTLAARAPSAAWTGTVAATPSRFRVEAAPDPLPPERVRLQLVAQVTDALLEAELLRATANRGDLSMAQRDDAVRAMAAPLLRAERTARRLARELPQDPLGARALAAAYAAQGERELAREVGAGSGPAGADSRPTAVDALQARALGAAPRLAHAAHGELLAKALEAARGGVGAPTAPATAAGPTPIPASQPTATPLATAPGKVSTGDPAVLDPQFAADALGQWASAATASSQYSTDAYCCARATGAPDVPRYGDDVHAWAPGTSEGGVEQLTVTFPAAAKATAVRVRQSFNPGAITRVLLQGGAGEQLEVFAGPDPNTYPAQAVGWFVVEFAAPAFAVVRVVVTLDTAKVPGWNEIDAVQLQGEHAAR